MIGDAEQITRSTGQSSVEMDGETVILDLSSGMYYGLDEVGSRVWDLIERPTTLSAIVEDICDEYDVERPVAVADIAALIEDLAAHGLVTLSS